MNRRVTPRGIQRYIGDGRSRPSIRISRVVILVDIVIVCVYRRVPSIECRAATIPRQVRRATAFLEVDRGEVGGWNGRGKSTIQ